MTSRAGVLTEEDLATYARDGFVVARGLLREEEILPTLAGIDRLLCARSADLTPSSLETVADDLHAKVLYLARVDRRALGVVYDAMRKLLSFWSALGSGRLARAVDQLLGTTEIGVAFRGAGIRLDLPHEDRFRSEWHQEYHSQISSMRGLVAWWSLVPVDEAMGPVRIARGSHREGLLPVRCLDPMNLKRDYTGTFEIADVPRVLAKYAEVSTTTGMGDVVFLDFFTLHRSGWNRSAEGKSRVTCQVRYFDMSEPVGVAHGWVGGWQDGGDFTKLHPEMVVDGGLK